MASSFGKFQLVKKLASGGMGEVYLASTAGSEQLLVLKRILPHLAENKEFLDLFLDEARIAARLNHPNVAQIFELGDVDGAWYLSMEYVPGKDLRQLGVTARNRRRPLPVALACRIAADAAAGLDYAHRACDAQGRPMQIVHRDVSPHNVLVSFDGAVKLIDFGVAKAVGRLQHTEGGVLRGKYPYMSPEQVTSGELDHRSDQFSLGVVLWELLSASRLFKADNDAQTLERVALCAVQPPARRGEVLPGALVELVMRALRKDPAQRFADLAEFRRELEELATAQQWPAGNAHLGAYLGGLFPEGARGESEADSAPTQSSRPLPEGRALSKSRSKSRPATAETVSKPGGAPPGQPQRAADVEQFIERACVARPGWIPSDAERRSIEQLVRALDGVPLAIELAAARIAKLSLAQLVEQLPPRPGGEEILRGAIDWSWALLEPHEQAALAQLGVLPGEFTLEAAEAVISLAAFPRAPWALDVLQALRAQGLVRGWEAPGGAGELRFGLDERVRAYALKKLGPDGEREARARHPTGGALTSR